jgi:hypothetical protein
VGLSILIPATVEELLKIRFRLTLLVILHFFLVLLFLRGLIRCFFHHFLSLLNHPSSFLLFKSVALTCKHKLSLAWRSIEEFLVGSFFLDFWKIDLFLLG